MVPIGICRNQSESDWFRSVPLGTCGAQKSTGPCPSRLAPAQRVIRRLCRSFAGITGQHVRGYGRRRRRRPACRRRGLRTVKGSVGRSGHRSAARTDISFILFLYFFYFSSLHSYGYDSTIYSDSTLLHMGFRPRNRQNNQK